MTECLRSFRRLFTDAGHRARTAWAISRNLLAGGIGFLIPLTLGVYSLPPTALALLCFALAIVVAALGGVPLTRHPWVAAGLACTVPVLRFCGAPHGTPALVALLALFLTVLEPLPTTDG